MTLRLQQTLLCMVIRWEEKLLLLMKQVRSMSLDLPFSELTLLAEDPCSLGLDDLFTTFTIESLYTHSLDIKEPESGSYEAMSESETST
jgi:hypothetical protein